MYQSLLQVLNNLQTCWECTLVPSFRSLMKILNSVSPYIGLQDYTFFLSLTCLEIISEGFSFPYSQGLELDKSMCSSRFLYLVLVGRKDICFLPALNNLLWSPWPFKGNRVLTVTLVNSLVGTSHQIPYPVCLPVPNLISLVWEIFVAS